MRCDRAPDSQAVPVSLTQSASVPDGVQPASPASRIGRKRSRVRIHNQNMTRAAKAHAERKILGHLS